MEMEIDSTVVVGMVAVVIHLMGYALYNLQTHRGYSTPNLTSWALWALLAALSAFTYSAFSNDWVTTLLFYAGTAAQIFTLIFALSTGKFTAIRREEYLVMLLAVCAIFVWWNDRNAGGANIILLTATLLGGIPTILGVWRNPRLEKPTPWLLWSLAFALTIFNVFLRGNGYALNLAMPVGGLLMHGAVALLALRRLQPVKVCKSRSVSR